VKVLSLQAARRQIRALSPSDRDFLLERLIEAVVDLEADVAELRRLLASKSESSQDP